MATKKTDNQGPGQSRTDKIVASNLHRQMFHKRWSGNELARRSGVAQTHISAILRGKSSATMTTIQQLAEPFGLNGWHLLIEVPDGVDAAGLRRLLDSAVTSALKRANTLHVRPPPRSRPQRKR